MLNNDILGECGIRESGSSAGGETWNSLRKEEETFRLVCLYGVRMRERGAVSSGYVSVVYRFLEIEVSILRGYNFESERRITSATKGRLACTHNPVTIFAHAHTGTCLFELEILEQLYPVGELRILLQAPFPFARKPIWKRSSGR